MSKDPFLRKEEIDTWFEAAIDGLARAIFSEARANGRLNINDLLKYDTTLMLLNVTRSKLYEIIYQSEPPRVKLDEIKKRYF